MKALGHVALVPYHPLIQFWPRSVPIFPPNSFKFHKKHQQKQNTNQSSLLVNLLVGLGHHFPAWKLNFSDFDDDWQSALDFHSEDENLRMPPDTATCETTASLTPPQNIGCFCVVLTALRLQCLSPKFCFLPRYHNVHCATLTPRSLSGIEAVRFRSSLLEK